jgi:hypothetical protein
MTDIFLDVNGTLELVDRLVFKKRGKNYLLKRIRINGQNYKALNLDFWTVFP